MHVNGVDSWDDWNPLRAMISTLISFWLDQLPVFSAKRIIWMTPPVKEHCNQPSSSPWKKGNRPDSSSIPMQYRCSRLDTNSPDREIHRRRETFESLTKNTFTASRNDRWCRTSVSLLCIEENRRTSDGQCLNAARWHGTSSLMVGESRRASSNRFVSFSLMLIKSKMIPFSADTRSRVNRSIVLVERIRPWQFDHRTDNDGLRRGFRHEGHRIQRTCTRSRSWTRGFEEQMDRLIEFAMLLFEEVDCFDSLALSDGDEIGNHRFLSTGHLPKEDLMIRIESAGEKLADIWITKRKTTIWTNRNEDNSRCRFFVSPFNLLSYSMKYYLSNKQEEKNCKRTKRWGDKRWEIGGRDGECIEEEEEEE